MRLINTATLELQEFAENEIPEYAILSHRWGREEISFQDMMNLDEAKKNTEGYEKIVQFCKIAEYDGYDHGWVDTCCINKESSAELSEAINTMFRWYSQAEICYAYLRDVEHGGARFEDSEWFTRGWTLQELIAPKRLLFLASDWSEIGWKRKMFNVINKVTNIDEMILRGYKQLHEFSIAKKMSWASRRVTTRTEDRAYCLMGIFNVNMPLLYGEGDKAFIRLQEQIMRDSDDQSLFAWENDNISYGIASGLLARSPADFANTGNVVSLPSTTSMPFLDTNKGIQVHLPLQHEFDNVYSLLFDCEEKIRGKDVKFLDCVGIYLKSTSDKRIQFMRINRKLKRTLTSRTRQSSTVYVIKSVTEKDASYSSLYDQYIYNTMVPEYSEFHSEYFQPEPARSLILCLDGSYPNKPEITSNLYKFHRMVDRSHESQLSYYSKARSNKHSDIEACVRDAYQWLIQHHKIHDRIFLLGFSVGAYAAKRLAQMLEKFGIFSTGYTETVPVHPWNVYKRCDEYVALSEGTHEIWQEISEYRYMRAFRSRYCRPAGRVAFLGLFDTVDRATAFGPERFTISPAVSNKACIVRHAIALDEQGDSLRLNLMDSESKNDDVVQNIQEVWFPGSHADIGGIAPIQRNGKSNLSLIPLAWMVHEAAKAGVHFDLSTVVEHFELDQNVVYDDLEGIFSSKQLTDSLHVASTKGRVNATFNLGDESSKVTAIRKKTVNRLVPTYKYISSGWYFYWSFKPHLCSLRPREIPSHGLIHASVVHRMNDNPRYRPGNWAKQYAVWIIRNAEWCYEEQKWVVVQKTKDDPVGECYTLSKT